MAPHICFRIQDKIYDKSILSQSPSSPSHIGSEVGVGLSPTSLLLQHQISSPACCLSCLQPLRVTYSLVREECGEEICKYFGESGRNGFTRRGGEHLTNQDAEDENKSILKLHSNHHHNGRPVNFIMKVTDVHSSCLDRQVTERVRVSRGQF